MAEKSDREPTEEPSAKRLSDARKKGQVPRSRELSMCAVLAAGGLAVYLFGGQFVTGMQHLMQVELRLTPQAIFDVSALPGHFSRALLFAGKLVAPLLLLTLLAAALSPLALGGWSLTVESLLPKWEKINPLEGIARIFSIHGLIELIKSLAKVLLVGGVTYVLVMDHLNELIGLSQQDLDPATRRSADLIIDALLMLCASLVGVAAIDAPFQLWHYKRELRMTRQELRDEMKESEGRPEVKTRVRSLQMEMSRKRMMNEVPKADVIITNPTHFAVALKYSQSSMRAPIVIAKGTDLMAAQIRKIATSAGVPLLSVPDLARALYFSTELDREIPTALYVVVAQVLAHVYQIKAAQQYGGDAPAAPSDLKIPEEYCKNPR
jgi:flagellar biosynthetic protein FlhB